MKSVFDGWTKQLKGKLRDGNGGYCARGWLWRELLDYSADVKTIREAVDPIEERIGKWIIENMNPCIDSPYICNASGAIIWANNTGKLDIEGFKMVDLLTQGYVPEPQPEPAEQSAECLA